MSKSRTIVPSSYNQFVDEMNKLNSFFEVKSDLCSLSKSASDALKTFNQRGFNSELKVKITQYITSLLQAFFDQEYYPSEFIQAIKSNHLSLPQGVTKIIRRLDDIELKVHSSRDRLELSITPQELKFLSQRVSWEELQDELKLNLWRSSFNQLDEDFVKMKSLESIIRSMLPSLTNSQILEVITVFADKNYYPTMSFASELSIYLGVSNLGYEDFKQTLKQYVKLGLVPNTSVWECWENILLKQEKGELFQSIWFNAKFGIIPSERFLSDWLSCAKEVNQDLFANINVLWSISVLKIVNGVEVRDDIINKLVNSIESKLTPTLLKANSEFAHKLLIADFINDKVLLSDELRVLIINYIETIKPNSISELQNNVIHKLKPYLKDYAVQEEYFIESIGSRVDAYVADLNLIIQVDGRSHFTNDDNHKISYNQQTKLNSLLLAKLGFNEMRITYLDVEQNNKWVRIFSVQIQQLVHNIKSDRLSSEEFEDDFNQIGAPSSEDEIIIMDQISEPASSLDSAVVVLEESAVDAGMLKKKVSNKLAQDKIKRAAERLIKSSGDINQALVKAFIDCKNEIVEYLSKNKAINWHAALAHAYLSYNQFAIDYCLDNGADVNNTLWLAKTKQEFSSIEGVLIFAGASIEGLGAHSINKFLKNTAKEPEDIINYLINENKVNTTISYAAVHQMESVVGYLVKLKNADIEIALIRCIIDRDFQDILFSKTIPLLLTYGASFNRAFARAITCEERHGIPDCVASLLKFVDLNQALVFAVSKNKEDYIIKRIVKEGADINKALMIACEAKNDIAVLRLTHEYKADLTLLLDDAYKDGKYDLVIYGYDFEERARALYRAVYDDNQNVINYFSQQEDLVLLQRIALIWAIEHKNFKIIQSLIKQNNNKDILTERELIRYTLLRESELVDYILKECGVNKEAVFKTLLELLHNIQKNIQAEVALEFKLQIGALVAKDLLNKVLDCVDEKRVKSFKKQQKVIEIEQYIKSYAPSDKHELCCSLLKSADITDLKQDLYTKFVLESVDWDQVLLFALQKDSQGVMDKIYASGADIARALYWAVQKEDESTANLIIRNNAKYDLAYEALYWAVKKSDDATAKILINKFGANTLLALSKALSVKDYDVAEILIKNYNVDVNEAILCVVIDFKNIANILINKYGANIDIAFRRALDSEDWDNAQFLVNNYDFDDDLLIVKEDDVSSSSSLLINQSLWTKALNKGFAKALCNMELDSKGVEKLLQSQKHIIGLEGVATFEGAAKLLLRADNLDGFALLQLIQYEWEADKLKSMDDAKVFGDVIENFDY